MHHTASLLQQQQQQQLLRPDQQQWSLCMRHMPARVQLQTKQPLVQPVSALPQLAAGQHSCCCHSPRPHRSSSSSSSPALGPGWGLPTDPGSSSRPSAVKAAGRPPGRGPAWRPPPQQPQPQPQQPAPPAPSPPPMVPSSQTAPPDGITDMFTSYAKQLQEAMQQQQPTGPMPGANVVVKGVGFHPPGAEAPLLDKVDFHLKPNQLGLVIGRSGSGKTTLLQLLAGLTEQTAGDVFIHRPSQGDHGSGLFLPTHIEQRMQQVGLVFQFPERHFLGDDVMQEMTFTWPRAMSHWGQRQAMAVRMQQVIDAVGLSDIPFNIPPSALSGGQQRRLALALQLVRAPSLLLLDEPLAGLDWVARREVVSLLRELKKEATLLVVSHDLADIAPLVDCAWRMKMGGQMESVQWPPESLSDMED